MREACKVILFARASHVRLHPPRSRQPGMKAVRTFLEPGCVCGFCIFPFLQQVDMAASSLFSTSGPTEPSREGGLFRSFWMAGYEGADYVNSAGCPLSMNKSNHHWQQLDADYALLARFGIRTVRESIGWRVTEQQGDAGFERLRRHAELAEKRGIEVIWSLMHYGWPADIDLLSPSFVGRFCAFSEKVARTLGSVSASRRFYQPINEISFLAWVLSSTGLMRHEWRTPFSEDGVAVKMQLVRAALRACETINCVDPGARFMHGEPLIHVASPCGAAPEALEAARRHSASVFKAWDMLCGRAEPQLGTTAACGTCRRPGLTVPRPCPGASCVNRMPSNCGAGNAIYRAVRGLQRKLPALALLPTIEEPTCQPSLFFHTCAGTLSTNGHSICFRAWLKTTRSSSWKSPFPTAPTSSST